MGQKGEARMVKFEINELFRAIIGAEIMINALFLWIKKRSDYTFLDINIHRRKIRKIKLVEGIGQLVCVILILLGMCLFMRSLPMALNIKNESVTGTILSVEEISKEYSYRRGVIVIQRSNGEKVKVRQVYYDSNEIINQKGELLLLPSQLANNILVKTDGEYTDFYKKYYQTPNVINKKARMFLLVYLILSFGYVVWSVIKYRREFQIEKEKICFLAFRRTKFFYYTWMIAGVAYVLELFILLLNFNPEKAMAICLPITYVIYKLGFLLFYLSRYYYIILKNDVILIKNIWREDKEFPREKCVIENCGHDSNLMICFPNGKKRMISKNNSLVQELGQKR